MTEYGKEQGANRIRGQLSLQARIMSFKGSCVHILIALRTDVMFILPFILHYF